MTAADPQSYYHLDYDASKNLCSVVPTSDKPQERDSALHTLAQLAELTDAGAVLHGADFAAVAKSVFEGYEARYKSLSPLERLWHQLGVLFGRVSSRGKVHAAYQKVLEGLRPENRIPAMLRAATTRPQPEHHARLIEGLKACHSYLVRLPTAEAARFVEQLDDCRHRLVQQNPDKPASDLEKAITDLCHTIIFGKGSDAINKAKDCLLARAPSDTLAHCSDKSRTVAMGILDEKFIRWPSLEYLEKLTEYVDR